MALCVRRREDYCGSTSFSPAYDEATVLAVERNVLTAQIRRDLRYVGGYGKACEVWRGRSGFSR